MPPRVSDLSEDPLSKRVDAHAHGSVKARTHPASPTAPRLVVGSRWRGPPGSGLSLNLGTTPHPLGFGR